MCRLVCGQSTCVSPARGGGKKEAKWSSGRSRGAPVAAALHDASTQRSRGEGQTWASSARVIIFTGVVGERGMPLFLAAGGLDERDNPKRVGLVVVFSSRRVSLRLCCAVGLLSTVLRRQEERAHCRPHVGQASPL